MVVCEKMRIPSAHQKIREVVIIKVQLPDQGRRKQKEPVLKERMKDGKCDIAKQNKVSEKKTSNKMHLQKAGSLAISSKSRIWDALLYLIQTEALDQEGSSMKRHEPSH